MLIIDKLYVMKFLLKVILVIKINLSISLIVVLKENFV